jgi:hypothetical protein
MRERARVRALLIAVVVFDIAFIWPGWSGIPVLRYLPLARRWIFAPKVTGLAMDWYGRLLFSSVIASIAYGITARRRRAVDDTSLRLWALWALVATLLTLALQVFQLAPRRGTPEPLPPGYVPR